MKVLIAGDFYSKNRVNPVIANKDFSLLFDEVKPIICKVDFSIVNFEFPIVGEHSGPNPIPKYGPNLCGSVDSIEAIKYAGFKCCVLANNHILDQGEQCCLDTKNELEKAGIDTVGVGQNLSEVAHILYKEINGEVLAIINCCELEFSIATEKSAGANPLNPIRQYYAISEAKKKADYVLVIVHGGHEHFQLPSPRMQETYRFFIDAGADAVVNHHQHCYSGYELYNSKPIFYGLGNFLFDWNSTKRTSWNEGFMLEIDTKLSGKESYTLYPYVQCFEKPTIRLLGNEDTADFYKRIEELNEVISNPSKLMALFNDYYSQSSKGVLSMFEPYSGRLLRKLLSLGLLPRFVKGKKLTQILNYVACESHRDRLIYILQESIKKL